MSFAELEGSIMCRKILVVLLTLSAGAQASTLSFEAVKINGSPIAPTGEVTILPGDTVECEVFLSGWGGDIPDGVFEYVFTLDSLGMANGYSGVVRPLIYSGPIPMRNYCSSQSDCATGLECVFAHCQPPVCNTLADCPPLARTCTGSCEYDDNSTTNAGLPEYGYFIDVNRADYLFAEVPNHAAIVRIRAPQYNFNAVADALELAVFDSGIPRYIGTVIVAASAHGSSYGEACGRFTLGALVVDTDHLIWTFLSGAHGDPEVLPAQEPLTIDVACTPPGTCCDCITGACMDDWRASECTSSRQVFTEGAICASNGCGSCVIPTVSEWGLVTLTLLLFVGAKVWFGHARRLDSAHTA